jgi:hypothetical protein
MSEDRALASSPAQEFASEGNIPFHEDLPLCEGGTFPPSLQAIVYESFLQTMDLRSGERPDHGRQLELILDSAGPHGDAVREWAESFAALHGLAVTRNGRSSRVSEVASRSRAFADRLLTALNTYTAEWPEFALRDVYEASVAAAAIRRESPSKFRNFGRLRHRLRGRTGRNEPARVASP